MVAVLVIRRLPTGAAKLAGGSTAISEICT